MDNNMPFNMAGFGNRFGNLPLPVEMSDNAADGEFMVSKTTGHMYVRNGNKNVSKTVEIEEFLKAFRVGCINSIMQSGEFYESLANKYWYINNNLINPNLAKPEYFTDPETNKTFMRVVTNSAAVGWSYMYNTIGSYNRLKFKKGDKVCFSIKIKADKPFRMGIRFHTSSSTDLKIDLGTIDVTTTMTKFEATKVLDSDVLFSDQTVLFLDLIGAPTSTTIIIENMQFEPGDRSSAWRQSWLDFYDRLSNMNDELKDWVKKQIQIALESANSYTDNSIKNLVSDVKQWITNAVDESKKYTDDNIKVVNKTISDNKKEMIRRDTVQRVHINLGQQDYTEFVIGNGGVFIESEKGVVITGPNSMILNLPVPITYDSKYAIRVKGTQVIGSAPVCVGLDCLNANLMPIVSDPLQLDYEMNKSVVAEGADFEFMSTYSGFTASGRDKAFKAGTQYFRVAIYANLNSSSTFKTTIKDIEIFEIPKCLWDALYTATPSTDGLMSSSDKDKLDTVERNANDYKHPTGDGNLHVPATGSNNNGKVLTAGGSPGSLQWQTPSTDADTLDGMDSKNFMRKVDPPSSYNCDDFLEQNAYFGWDSGEAGNSNLLCTPLGNLIITNLTKAVVCIVKNYAAWKNNNDCRVSQEFILVYPSQTTTRYVRTYAGGVWGDWQKVYTTGDRPTPSEIGAVDKTGDNMSGSLSFRDDNLGVNFPNGGKIFKKPGGGIVIQNENNTSDIEIQAGTSGNPNIAKLNPDKAEFNGNIKGRNLDLGRYSIIYDDKNQCLDFIFK